MKFFVFFFALVTANTNMQYPGRNHKLKAIIQDQWEKYYDCLENDFQSLGPFRRRKLNIRLAFPGQAIRLPCTRCFRPFEDRRELEWRYQPLETNAKGKDFTDLPSEFTLSDSQDLQVRNAKSEFTGIYQCFRGNSSLSAYLLEVPLLVDIVQVNHTTPNESPMESFGTSLKLSVAWDEWSECSVCGPVGKRYQYGVCMLTILTDSTQDQTNQTTRRQKKDIASDVYQQQELNQNKTYENGEGKTDKQIQEEGHHPDNNQKEKSHGDSQEQKQGIFHEIYQLVSMFEKGIPCSSRFLSEDASGIIKNLGATHLAAIDLCKVDCPTETPAEEIDLKEKITEAAGNIEMALKNIQDRISTVEREEIDAIIDTFVVLQCPGLAVTKNISETLGTFYKEKIESGLRTTHGFEGHTESSNENIPVQWKVTDRDIVPEIIVEQTQGRIFVDIFHRIIIQQTRLHDSNVYSCWKRSRLIGTIHLQVERQGLPEDDYLSFMSVVTGLFIIFLAFRIGRKAIKHRKIK